jgi:hypothetical protein
MVHPRRIALRREEARRPSRQRFARDADATDLQPPSVPARRERFLYLEGDRAPTLAESAFVLTPKVALPTRSQVFLELTATTHALGGWEAQRALAEELLERTGPFDRIAFVDRAAWAPALAERWSGPFLPNRDPSQSAERLWTLPIEQLTALALPGDVDEALFAAHCVVPLRRVAIDTLGRFAALAPDTVQRRFGRRGLRLHRRLVAAEPLPLSPFHDRTPLVETLDAEECFSLDALWPELLRAMTRVGARLSGRRQEARELTLALRCEGAPRFLREALLLANPTADGPRLAGAVLDWLAARSLPGPLRTLTITVHEAVDARRGQLSLFGESPALEASIGAFVGRLRQRYGEERVGFPAPRESHWPERSFRLQWPPPPPSAVSREAFPERPLWLFDPPRPWTPGPETTLLPLEIVAPEWWRGESAVRHYFLAESREAALWVFEERASRSATDSRWYLHGRFR